MELSVEQNVWTEMEEVIGVWRNYVMKNAFLLFTKKLFPSIVLKMIMVVLIGAIPLCIVIMYQFITVNNTTCIKSAKLKTWQHVHLQSFHHLFFHSVDPYRITKSIWIWK